MTLVWGTPTLVEVNDLLRREHYLGPARGGRVLLGGYVDGSLVACQVWRAPTSRRLNHPAVLELTRWCLTPTAGVNAGSRMHRAAVKAIKASEPEVEVLVSYSDPSNGHGGSLYRACNWLWAPTWHRLRPPPTGFGSWDGKRQQAVKDRWVFPLRRRLSNEVVELFRMDDMPAIRAHLRSDEWATTTHRWPVLIPWHSYGLTDTDKENR